MAQTAVQLKPRQEQGAGRYDIYQQIHKGLRSFMTHVLEQLGRMDVWDECETVEALAQLRALLGLCRSHLDKENEFLHVAMEARRPGSSAKIALEHAHHEHAIESLAAAAREVEHAAGAARAAAALRLYRALALFVAENFEHMHAEETVNNAVLWEDYDDAELAGIERAIVASVGPEEAMLVGRWMLPAMTAGDRAAQLRAMRQAAPAAAVAGVLAMLKQRLSERDWYKLGAALGPGAV
jgi:hypothetical protein